MQIPGPFPQQKVRCRAADRNVLFSKHRRCIIGMPVAPGPHFGKRCSPGLAVSYDEDANFASIGQSSRLCTNIARGSDVYCHTYSRVSEISFSW